MIRNFVAGTLWGVVVAGVGLAVVSQVAPLPGTQARNGVDAVAQGDGVAAKPVAEQPDGAEPPVTKPASVPVADAVPDGPAAVAPAPAKGGKAAPVMPDVPGVKPAEKPAPKPSAPAPALSLDTPAPEIAKPAGPAKPPRSGNDDQLALGKAADAPPAIIAAPPGLADAPPPLAAPGVASGAASVELAPFGANDPAVKLALPAGVPDAGQTDAVPDAADVPPPAPEALLDPAPAIKANPAPATIAPDAAEDSVPALPEPAADVPAAGAPAAQGAALQPVKPAEPPPSLFAKDQPSTFLPDAGVKSGAGDVTTGRLPRIGDLPADAAAQPVGAQPAGAVDLPAVQQFAQAFDNPSGKPLFAVILRDTGGADVDRASLAALPFPVSFVVDPMAPDAAQAAAIYRAAGQEVIMLATGIPAGAQASDLEQSFQSLGAVLPQAVAVMDLATGGFQDDRPLATLVVPIVKAQGRGLITFNRGLNAADQVARRIDVPAATIFRQLDASGEDVPLIRRYLDRAAFKAAQEGRVMVLGETRPQTIAALMEWTVEGRASSVTLAPATAVLSVD